MDGVSGQEWGSEGHNKRWWVLWGGGGLPRIVCRVPGEKRKELLAFFRFDTIKVV